MGIVFSFVLIRIEVFFREKCLNPSKFHGSVVMCSDFTGVYYVSDSVSCLEHDDESAVKQNNIPFRVLTVTA